MQPSNAPAPATTAASWLQNTLASIGSIFQTSKEDESESDAISGWVGTKKRRCRSVGEAR
ncbi:hypothetical protein N7447_002653 [Penicillium robsamsonii]|uniref:uncharacterized protein n=1 Tax=Penicillium robsamsonii TaxID=1792511 RepID=UPI00254752F0|nr:uncharacterized protein N7447_002653 [Penicillium robsamsonii]KAJ5836627.1 hypothetical protein N7447_002653 [Penicillium robsamsonii]